MLLKTDFQGGGGVENHSKALTFQLTHPRVYLGGAKKGFSEFAQGGATATFLPSPNGIRVLYGTSYTHIS